MTFGLPNTSEPDRQQNWLTQQERLISSLRDQPLLLVVRAQLNDFVRPFSASPLFGQLQQLRDSGLRHVEIAWLDHPDWCEFYVDLKSRCPEFQLGAASIVDLEALDDLKEVDAPYAMAPCWDPSLQQRALDRGLLVVPGVFSPSEVLQAIRFGHRLVKLFPAAELGCRYWMRLKAPLGDLPAVIAAGGLGIADVEEWLQAGHHAVALGRSVIGSAGVNPDLLIWLKQSTSAR